MNEFVKLFLRLDQTNKTNEKLEALQDFITNASPTDQLWLIALFTGRSPKRPIASPYLQEWAMEEAKLPAWLFYETVSTVGDLAETLGLILPENSIETKSSLTEWMALIKELGFRELSERKEIILAQWRKLSTHERIVFNKLLLGGFRIGISQNLIIRAIANVTGEEASVITHRLMGNWDPMSVDPNFLLGSTTEQAQYTRPYPFCLAYPLDMEPEELGSPNEWSFEWKWDGIRGQAVHRNEFFTLWSRGEEMVNDRFPELLQLQGMLPNGLVLDGEILAHENEKILPFQFLQQRLGRKVIPPALLKKIPVFFLAYDLLEWNGKDWRQQPFQERRKQLESLVATLPNQSVLKLSPQLKINSWDEAKDFRSQSRESLAEGLMLKKLSSPYHVGRKRGDWWKWKIESYTVDAVLIYAQMGHGWRANVYSDYTFAIWDKGQLIPFAKAYSGLTKQELAEVDRFVKKNTVEKFGPVRSVKPELVFEIAFEGIQESRRHKSGVAVRFPRIARWRPDKKPEDADSLDSLRALLRVK